MRIKSISFFLAPFLSAVYSQGAAAGDPYAGLKVSREGVLYRIDEATPASARHVYRILEREADADTAAALDAAMSRLNSSDRVTLKELATLLLKDQGIAVRFSGQRAVAKSGALVGPIAVSGSLLGALRNLGTQAGLQMIVHRDAVEYTEQKSFSLTLPSYESQGEVASRLMGTGASNIKVSGAAINFDADADALRAVQHVVRELRQGRRGVNNFLSDIASRQPAGVTPPKPATTPSKASTEPSTTAEQALIKQMGLSDQAQRDSAPVANRQKATPASAGPDPLLAATVSIEFKGDLIKAVERLAAEANVTHRVVSSPAKPLAVKLNLRHVPLQVALEALGAQTKGKADIVYEKSARRIDIHAR